MKSLFPLFPLVALILLVGCQQQPATITDITPEKLLSLGTDAALILDVRSPEEFASGHVPGAVNISHEEVAGRIAELEDHKSRPVVVYCEKGGRASKAATALLDAGFADVRHLAGDMGEWRSAGRPMDEGFPELHR